MVKYTIDQILALPSSYLEHCMKWGLQNAHEDPAEAFRIALTCAAGKADHQTGQNVVHNMDNGASGLKPITTPADIDNYFGDVLDHVSHDPEIAREILVKLLISGEDAEELATDYYDDLPAAEGAYSMFRQMHRSPSDHDAALLFANKILNNHGIEAEGRYQYSNTGDSYAITLVSDGSHFYAASWHDLRKAAG